MPYTSPVFDRRTEKLKNADSYHTTAAAWWSAVSGEVPLQHMTAMQTLFETFDTNDWWWDGSAGVVRLNLFIGNTGAEALVPQVAELGAAADSYIGNADDFWYHPDYGFGKHDDSGAITTGLTPLALANQHCAFGVLIPRDYFGSNFWESPLCSFDGATNVTGFRLSGSQAQGFVGNGAGSVAPNSLPSGSLYSIWSNATSLDTQVFVSTTTGGSGVTSSAPTYTQPFYVLACNQAGAQAWHPKPIMKVAGYFFWKGTWTDALRTAFITAMETFCNDCGRKEV